MKAKIIIDIPEEGCRTCRYKETRTLTTRCLFTEEKIDYPESRGIRAVSCPMEPIENTTEITPRDFTMRTYNCLRRAGYNTWGELREASEGDIMRIRGLGQKSYKEIVEKLNGRT